MLVIENCNSLSDLRQKLIDGEEVRTARDVEVLTREAYADLCMRASLNDVPVMNVGDMISRQKVLDKILKFSVTEGKSVSVTGLWTEVNDLPPVTPQSKIGHWIPVSEELPDKEGYYLCSVRYMYPPYNFFEPEKVKYMDDVTIQKFDGEFNIEVKAWMPLPPCYKPKESEE